MIIILISFFNNSNITYGANNNGIEVSKTNQWIEYIERDSINKKDKEAIEIESKYFI